MQQLRPRLLLAVCVLAGLVLLPACGEGDDATVVGARVRILTSAADGPVQGTVLLAAINDDEGRVYEAHPLASDPGVYVADDAPVGDYYVRTSEDWGMLWAGRGGSGAPLLRAGDHPETTVRMGKPRSLYVAAANPGLIHGHVGNEWGADWKLVDADDGRPFARADVEVVPQGEGLVALRFPASIWKAGHVIRAGGEFQSGAVSQIVSFVKRPRNEALPYIAFTSAAPPAPLRVEFVPPQDPSLAAEGLRVDVSLEAAPHLRVYTSTVDKGVARFDDIGSVGDGLGIQVHGGLGPYAHFEIDEEIWRLQGVLHLLSAASSALVEVPLEAGSETLRELRVLQAGATRFARVPLRHDEGGRWTTWALPGAQRWLFLRGDGTWIEQEVVVPADTTAPAPVVRVPDAGRPAARVQGSVTGGAQGFRVQLTLLEGSDVRIRGAGLSASVDSYGRYDLRVPPGRYEIQAANPNGSLGPPRILPLRPGIEARVDLPIR